MNRDGILKSIWEEGIPGYQPVNSWNANDLYDVLIVGGGITGLTTALLLQSAGKKCILAEAANIGFGTTGGTTAHINTILDTTYNDIEKDFSDPDAKLVASGTKQALQLIEILADTHKIDCDFSFRSAYMLADTDEEVEELGKIKDASLRAGIPVEWGSAFSFPLPFKKACHFPRQAQFHSLKYIQGLAKAYEGKGGVLLQQCVVGKVNSDEYHTADCSLGKIKAHYIVYATHIPPGVNLLHFRNAPYRSYAAAFRLNSGEYPTGLFYDMKEPYHYFRTQVVNGQEYIIGGGFDHKTGHSLNTEHVFTELEAFLRRHFDISEIAYHWSSQYFEPADGLPYIGLLPGHDKTYTATGFSGNGMTLGTLAAITISDLITKNESPYAELFAPSRMKPVAGFETFVKENADVISQFIGMRFSYEKIETLAELAPGDAILADWENRKLALYKDEQGKIHAVDPICPHAGCLVAWNNAEKSWDCPCHGSRFSCNGALLTGPAHTGLTPILTDNMEGD